MALMKKSQYDKDGDGKVDADAIANHQHIVADLTDHNKATHDALLIDADTVDGKHATDLETRNFADRTGARALGTIYQNTTGRYLLIFVSLYNPSSNTTTEYAYAEISQSSLFVETIMVSLMSLDPSSSGHAHLIVPPGWYYRVGSSNLQLDSWVEVEI